jgi:hypothetical protein
MASVLSPKLHPGHCNIHWQEKGSIEPIKQENGSIEPINHHKKVTAWEHILSYTSSLFDHSYP